jgi:hypothetical protein
MAVPRARTRGQTLLDRRDVWRFDGMNFSYLARLAVNLVDRIPAVLWAVWIVGVMLGAAVLALTTHPVG